MGSILGRPHLRDPSNVLALGGQSTGTGILKQGAYNFVMHSCRCMPLVSRHSWHAAPFLKVSDASLEGVNEAIGRRHFSIRTAQ